MTGHTPITLILGTWLGASSYNQSSLEQSGWKPFHVPYPSHHQTECRYKIIMDAEGKHYSSRPDSILSVLPHLKGTGIVSQMNRSVLTGLFFTVFAKKNSLFLKSFTYSGFSAQIVSRSSYSWSLHATIFFVLLRKDSLPPQSYQLKTSSNQPYHWEQTRFTLNLPDTSSSWAFRVNSGLSERASRQYTKPSSVLA